MKDIGKINSKCFFKTSQTSGMMLKGMNENCKKCYIEISSSKKRAEIEHVNPSLQKNIKIGIVREDLILERSFFLFDISRIYLPGMNLNDERSSGGLQEGQPN